MKIIAISGSLRQGSFNTLLVKALGELVPEGFELEQLEIDNLPLFNQDQEQAMPAEAAALKEKIEGAAAVVIATPEYNRSVPGGLKNALDWASRPYGKNSFAGKPVLVMGVSSGKIGTALAQSHLKESLLYLDARVLGQPELYLGPAKELFTESGALAQDSTKELLKKALATLAGIVGK